MIYLLEDDKSIVELLLYSLNKTGNEGVAFGTPSEFYAAIKASVPDLVILDIMLPEEDGLTVLSRIRKNEKTAKVPVIMLTAKGSEFDKVTAFEIGADDYVTKPFGVMEFIARVKAVLRRCAERNTEDEKIYVFENLKLSVPKRELTIDGEAVALTYKEFLLLVLLFEADGAVQSRDKILRDVWGYEFDGENRTVDVHVRTLRQKLGRYGDIVETVRGFGYKISTRSSAK